MGVNGRSSHPALWYGFLTEDAILVFRTDPDSQSIHACLEAWMDAGLPEFDEDRDMDSMRIASPSTPRRGR